MRSDEDVPGTADLRPFPTDWERALIIAAHPDDIEWGTGAAVSTWTGSGKDVRYLLVTRGEAGIADLAPDRAGPVREREQRQAAGVLGVTDVSFLDHPDGRIEEGLALRRELAAAIRRHRPEVVVTINHQDRWGAEPGAPWNSADHRAVGRATLDATGDAGNRWIFPDLAAAGLEPWGARWVAIQDSPATTHGVDVSGQVDRAAASLAAHRRYLRALRDGDPEGYAREIVEGVVARAAGRFGGRPAVAFELLAL